MQNKLKRRWLSFFWSAIGIFIPPILTALIAPAFIDTLRELVGDGILVTVYILIAPEITKSIRNEIVLYLAERKAEKVGGSKEEEKAKLILL